MGWTSSSARIVTPIQLIDLSQIWNGCSVLNPPPDHSPISSWDVSGGRVSANSYSSHICTVIVGSFAAADMSSFARDCAHVFVSSLVVWISWVEKGRANGYGSSTDGLPRALIPRNHHGGCLCDSITCRSWFKGIRLTWIVRRVSREGSRRERPSLLISHLPVHMIHFLQRHRMYKDYKHALDLEIGLVGIWVSSW